MPNVMKIWEFKPPETLWATPVLLRHSFTFAITTTTANSNNKNNNITSTTINISLRHMYLGYFLEPEDIKSIGVLGVGAIEAPVTWYRMRGTKGLF
jgi:hypothetical protein